MGLAGNVWKSSACVNRPSDDLLSALTAGLAKGPELRPGPMQLLAVDRTQGWAAAFRFSIYDDGDCEDDTVLFRQVDSGWEEMISGGTSGSGWPLPWSPPPDGWNGEPLTFLSRIATSLDNSDGHEVGLSALSGFAAAGVRAVRVTTPLDEHVALVVPLRRRSSSSSPAPSRRLTRPVTPSGPAHRRLLS